MSNATYLIILALACPFAIFVGAYLGILLAKYTTENQPGGRPRCVHCGKRSPINNVKLYLNHKGELWLCTRCGQPNQQKLLGAKLKVRKR